MKIKYKNYFYLEPKDDENGLRVWKNFGKVNNIKIEAFW